MKKIHEIAGKLAIPNWLAIILFATLILRIPSFFEPYYYGDEMIYMTLGNGLRQGVPFYSGLHDNKPPVLYLIAAIAGSLVWFKVLLAVAGIVSTVFFAKIIKNLFEKNTKLQIVSTIIFAFATTLPLLEGNTANAENFMMAFTLPAIYILLAKSPKFINLFSSGVLFSLAFLTKVPAMFDLPVIIIFWLIVNKFDKKSIIETLKKTSVILLGFAIPIAITFIWYYLAGNLSDYIKAAFMQNVGYVSSWRPDDVQKGFIARNLPLLIRAFIVFTGIIIVFAFKKKLSKPFILSSAWVLLSLFAVTLSERPYPHYLLQTVAPVSILLGILFATKSLNQSLTVIPLFVTLFVPVYYKFWYYPTTAYYLRFFKFAVGESSREKYFSEFNGNISRNYQIADFLVNSTGVNDKVFVWGPDSPTIYALARRTPPIKFVADYHIRDFSTKADVAASLAQTKPKFIIITPEAEDFEEIWPILKTDYLLINKIDNAEFWSLIQSQKR